MTYKHRYPEDPPCPGCGEPVPTERRFCPHCYEDIEDAVRSDRAERRWELDNER